MSHRVRKISIAFDDVPCFDQFNLRGKQYRKNANGTACPIDPKPGEPTTRILPRGVIVRWVGVQHLPPRSA